MSRLLRGWGSRNESSHSLGSNSRTETDWVVPENPEEESKDDAEEAEEAAASEDGDD